jgi:hypothetical protein
MSAGDAGLGIGTANIHYFWRGKNGAKQAVQGRPIMCRTRRRREPCDLCTAEASLPRQSVRNEQHRLETKGRIDPGQRLPTLERCRQMPLNWVLDARHLQIL